jgi:MYXO-CTERM domain-containing protein
MHFHNAPVGVSGGVDLGIPSPWTSPYVGSATLDAAQQTNLLAGDWYVNIHTSDFGGGEIRGQVGVTQVPEPSASLLGLAALAGLALRRRRAAF